MVRSVPGAGGLTVRAADVLRGCHTTLSSETEFFLSNVLADDVAAYWTDSYVEKNTF